MDNTNYTTNFPERKRGQHLDREARGAIQTLKKLGYSNRFIAKTINCSPSTVGYELLRGTPDYTGRGRKPSYSAKRGHATYQSNRSRCRRPQSIPRQSTFIQWMVQQVREHKWSFDTCVGFARLMPDFQNEVIPSTKTLYHMLWKGELPLNLFELPEVLKRKKHGKPRLRKRNYGKSIEERPEEVALRNTFGHWEGDTVQGKKKKGEPVVFTLVERLTGNYLSIKIQGKTTAGVAQAMLQLKEEFGELFHEVFKSITVDNGSEFADFETFERWGTKIYYAHPYSSWERGINERMNRVLRKFIQKGRSISAFSAEEILSFADEINATPTKRLGYRIPEQLFDAELDKIYRN